MSAPYPTPDYQRAARVRADIAALLHQDPEDAVTAALLDRWVGFVLADAEKLSWWFLNRADTIGLTEGQDLIDLSGHLSRLQGLFAAARLAHVPLARVLEARGAAAAANTSNAAPYPGYYALEGGRRVHLWPAPSADVTLTILYQRPMDIALVPDAFEPVLVNGVLGRYGRHWDRDALSQDPAEFERRYRRDLALLYADGAQDAIVINTQELGGARATLATPGSMSDTAVAHVVPASLSGIGAVSVELGDYPLEVA